MRILQWTILLSFLLSGCTTTYVLNERLPTVKNIKVLGDVSSAAFEWDKPKTINFDGFILKRNNGDNKTYEIVKSIKNPLATHTFDDDLKPTSTYSYVIQTYKGKEISKASQPVNVKTSFIDPVEHVFIVNTEPRTLKIIWNPHPNPSIESYLIQRQINGIFVTIAEVDHRLNVEYFDEDLADGVDYTYVIVAKDFNGNRSRPSRQTSSSTIEKPPALKGLQATNDRAKEIVISWEMPLDIESQNFRIYHSDDNIFFSPIAVTKNSSYIHKGLKDGEVGFYKVVILKENNLEGLSEMIVQGGTATLPSSPNITESIITAEGGLIRWESGGDSRSEKYIVYRKENGKEPLEFSEIRTLRFIDKEMRSGVTYEYSVSGVDKNGIVSSPSQSVKLKKD